MLKIYLLSIKVDSKSNIFFSNSNIIGLHCIDYIENKNTPH